jgi:hypothetical protein
VLNIGLLGLPLARQDGSSQFESDMKSCNSMKQIRIASSKKPTMKEGLQASIQPIISTVNSRFAHLKHGGIPIQIAPDPSSADLDALKQILLTINPAMNLTGIVAFAIMFFQIVILS